MEELRKTEKIKYKTGEFVASLVIFQTQIKLD